MSHKKFCMCGTAGFWEVLIVWPCNCQKLENAIFLCVKTLASNFLVKHQEMDSSEILENEKISPWLFILLEEKKILEKKAELDHSNCAHTLHLSYCKIPSQDKFSLVVMSLPIKCTCLK